MMKRLMAARKRPPRLTPMPILAPVERVPSSPPPDEVEFNEVVELLMLMAFPEKMSPEMPKTWPAAGSCSQPA